MLWKNLSNNAKSVLEWVEDPISGRKRKITVERNKGWYMPCAMGDIRILITDALFNEIKEYINTDKNIKIIENGEKILKFALAYSEKSGNTNSDPVNTHKENLKQKLLSIPVNHSAFRELHMLAKDIGTEVCKIEPLLNELCEKNILTKKIQYMCPSCRATIILSKELLQEEINEEGCIVCDNCMEYTINPEKDGTGFIYYDIKNRKELINW